MSSRPGPTLVLLVLLAAFGGFAWLTRHPDAAILDHARAWPVVGPLAERFQAAYLGAEPRGESDDPEVVIVESRPRPRAAPIESVIVEPVGALPFVWVESGLELLAAPQPGAEVIFEFAATANAKLVERRGDWFHVRHRSRQGWVHMPGYSETSSPPLGSAPVPPRPLAARPPDPTLLEAGRARFSGRERRARVGPHVLYTDTRDGRLELVLDRLATDIERIYERRYGLEPVGRPAGAVLLYAREDDYRSFQQRQQVAGGDGVAGHTGSGLIALFSEAKSREAVGSVLVHEMVHLLNRRAIGPALPPWLDEGLADDLAESEIDARGTLKPGVLGGEREETEGVVTSRGGYASAEIVRRAISDGTTTPLGRLLRLDHSEFVAPGSQTLHYAQSSMLVRYLLETRPEEFRAFLARVATGAPPSGEALLAELGIGWGELERSLDAWVAGLALGHGTVSLGGG